MNDEQHEHNQECESSDHERHLCYIISQGFHLSDPQIYNVMIDNPKYQCQHCNRKANSNLNLCVPKEIP